MVSARLSGVTASRIIGRHLLPAFTGYIIVDLVISFPYYDPEREALSFVGLGLRPPSITWVGDLTRGRNFAGFDFENLTRKVARQGAWIADLPTIRGPIQAGSPILPRDYSIAQSATDQPVKITLPGPLTITNSTVDAFYNDDAKLGADLAEALNGAVLALAQAGCQHIQIDEPVFARCPDDAIKFGFENLKRCFHGLPDHVMRTVHMCCGYQDHLDQKNFQKADQSAYFQLADAIECSTIDAISLEDAHRHNRLTLLEQFSTTKVFLGVIAIAQSKLETVEAIHARLTAALEHIDANRLLVAPDCGLGYFTCELALQKLQVMVKAAQSI